MNPEELNRFLASVRKTRFVDYLDPMGETAHEALERRLKWAARSRNDPAHADEAEFLLRNAAPLRQHLSQEQLEGDDDWIESAEAGSEWGGGAPRSTPAPARRATPAPAARSTPAPGGRAPTARRATPAPTDRSQAHRRPTPAGSDRRSPSLERNAPSSERRSATPSPGRMPAAPSKQNGLGGKKAAPPAPTGTGIMRIEDLTDPPAAPRRRGPEVARGASAPTDTSDTELSDELIRSISSRRVQSPSYTPAPAERSGLVEHEWVDQQGHTPAPSLARSAPSPVPARPRSDTPDTNEGSPRRALDIRASRSGEAVERERATRPENGPRPMFILAVAMLAAAAVMLVLVSGALFGGGGESEPEERVVARPAIEPEEVVAPELDPGLVDSEDGLASAEEPPGELGSDAVAEAVLAAPAATDAPTPTEAAAPAPVAVREVARHTEPAPKPSPPPPPVAKKPEPKPTPKVEPKPQPKPEPEPEQVAEARPSSGVDHVVEAPAPVTYPTLTGMWIGLAATKSFQLEIDSQSGGSFSGVAQVMNDAGGWDELRILGNVEADGSLRFSQMGGGASFSGTIDGIRASGSVKLDPNAEPAKWSVIK